jgi:hypothetical protein
VGHWPREEPVPIFKSIGQMKRYNNCQRRIQQANRRSGRPFWDFESDFVFVKKTDGGFRLCTDYQELNRFSGKSRFQMGGGGTTGGGADSSEELWHANRPKGLLPHIGLTPGASQVLPVPGPRRSTFSVEDRLFRHSGSASTLHEVAPPRWLKRVILT